MEMWCRVLLTSPSIALPVFEGAITYLSKRRSLGYPGYLGSGLLRIDKVEIAMSNGRFDKKRSFTFLPIRD